MSEIRKDPLSNTWVIIAPERAGRPRGLKAKTEEDKKQECPFCSPEIAQKPVDPNAICAEEFDDQGRWRTKVIQNKFPALRTEPMLEQKEIDGIYHLLEGVGGHEILIESPVHEHTFANMPLDQIKAVLRNYRCKYNYWRNDPRISYLSIFKNHGRRAGASLRHPHSQLIATPLIPPRISVELEEAKEYYEQNNRCLLCDTIKTEIKVKKRMVYENKTMAAFMPFAPRFPYETLIVPKRHSASFEDINENEIAGLAEIISVLFAKLDKHLADPPYNYIFHVAPLRTPGLLHYHWHIEVIVRITQPAGFEWGSGVYINSVPPEEAAKKLRETKV